MNYVRYEGPTRTLIKLAAEKKRETLTAREKVGRSIYEINGVEDALNNTVGEQYGKSVGMGAGAGLFLGTGLGAFAGGKDKSKRIKAAIAGGLIGTAGSAGMAHKSYYDGVDYKNQKVYPF